MGVMDDASGSQVLIQVLVREGGIFTALLKVIVLQLFLKLKII